jgi:phosphoribosylaminoimidazole carboxylase
VVRTVHKDSILFLTESPADVTPPVAEAARNLALKAIGCLDGSGIFGYDGPYACQIVSNALRDLEHCY